MIYGSRRGGEWDFHEIKSDVFKVCVFHAACVTSFPDYSNLGDKDYEGVFANYDLVVSQRWNQKGKGGEVWFGHPGC